MARLLNSAQEAETALLPGSEELRAAEFSRSRREVYLDHAGATLPSERQLQDVFQVLHIKMPADLVCRQCISNLLSANST